MLTDADSQSFPRDLRVLVVADDPLARAGLANLLEAEADCRVVDQLGGEAGLAEALALRRPDVVVWDLGWEPDRSLEALARLEEETPPVVALVPDAGIVPALRSSGLQGLLLRDADAGRLGAALRAAAEGLLAFDPSLSASLLPSGVDSAPPPVEELTPREIEVLQLLAEGLSNRAIAQQLEISEHTVKFHINAIFGKLGVQSRTEAAVRAARLGLILL